MPAHRRSTAPQPETGTLAQEQCVSTALSPSAPVAVTQKPILTSALVLPGFSSEIPCTLEFVSGVQGQQAVGAIAQALLDCKVMGESDWQGNLPDSLHYALTGWVDGICEMDQVKICNLDLHLFDSDDQEGFEWNGAPSVNSWWYKNIGAVENVPIGSFVLVGSPYGNDIDGVTIGSSIMKIENVRKGAGFAIMGLINLACDMSVGGVTPRWAWAAAQYYHSFDQDRAVSDEQFDADESGLITEDDFFRAIPLSACTAVWNNKARKAVQAALTALGNFASAGIEGQILEQALKLDEAIQIAQCELNRFHNADGKPEVTCNQRWALYESGDWPIFWARWSEKDPMTRILDDHLEGIWECGGVTQIEDETGDGAPIIYLRAFQLGLPEQSAASLHNAIRATEHALRIVSALDALLCLMHSEDEPPPHPFVKPRKPRQKKPKLLAEILA